MIRRLKLLAPLTLAVGCFSPGDTPEGESSGTGDSGTLDDGGPADGGPADSGPADGGPAGDGGPSTSATSGSSDSGGPATSGMPTGDDSSGTDDPSASGTAGPACAADEFCAAPAPIGWEGPVALLNGAGGADPCPAELPSQVDVAFDDLQVPAHSCSCQCDGPVGTNCGAATMRARTANNCVAEEFFPPIVNFQPGVCQNVSSYSAGSWTADLANFPLEAVTGGTCAPIENINIPPTTWGQDFRTCALATPPAACQGSGTCQPDLGVDAAPMCIFQPGDHPCPPGDYTERQLVFQDVADSRDCSTCSCGSPVGMCHGDILFASDCGAFAIFYGAIAVDECAPISSLADAGTYSLQPNASCTAAGGAVQGTAAADEPLTMCCLP